MPIYQIREQRIEITRQALILDTNVLVQAFDPDEEHHEDARYFLDEYPYQWLVSVAVVVETWGFLVGKNKNWQAGYRFMAWLNTPGKALVIIPQSGDLTSERSLIEALHLDCVDAIIGSLANDISISCDLASSIPVATYDTRDFYRLRVQGNLRLNIYDMNTDVLQNMD